jgi:hypothetical protein
MVIWCDNIDTKDDFLKRFLMIKFFYVSWIMVFLIKSFIF